MSVCGKGEAKWWSQRVALPCQRQTEHLWKRWQTESGIETPKFSPKWQPMEYRDRVRHDKSLGPPMQSFKKMRGAKDTLASLHAWDFMRSSLMILSNRKGIPLHSNWLPHIAQVSCWRVEITETSKAARPLHSSWCSICCGRAQQWGLALVYKQYGLIKKPRMYNTESFKTTCETHITSGFSCLKISVFTHSNTTAGKIGINRSRLGAEDNIIIWK